MECPGTFLDKVVIIRKQVCLNVPMVQHISGLNKVRVSSVSLITRVGFMALLLKVNQTPRLLLHRGSAFPGAEPSSKPSTVTHYLVRTAGCRREEVRRRGTHPPFRKCLEVAHIPCSPYPLAST